MTQVLSENRKVEKKGNNLNRTVSSILSNNITKSCPFKSIRTIAFYLTIELSFEIFSETAVDEAEGRVNYHPIKTSRAIKLIALVDFSLELPLNGDFQLFPYVVFKL